MSETSHIRHRPDIDGLRAVAVLSVVASHIRLRFFDGGFVGVDVFFVISGFLIGSILLREVALTGRINYLEFYERRIRRIMPALIAMLLTVSAVAYIIYLPKDLVEFARMAASTLLFSANIYLSRSGSYFGFEAANNFLTHTWSLGVEEQFYILLPPLLMLFRKRVINGSISTTIAWLAGISLAISIPSAYLAPTATFYLLPTRVWELLAGTLAYLYMPAIRQRSAKIQATLAFCGITAILLPVTLASRVTPFPGSAVLPCLGAVLLLATGDSLIHRILSWPIPVKIGQLSYSLYLWHWPLVVYSRMYSPFGKTNSHIAKLCIFAFSLLLAYISWRWIETPFRRGDFRLTSRNAPRLAAGYLGAILTAAAVITLSHGASYRYSPAELQIASYQQTGGELIHFHVGTCFLEDATATHLPGWSECLRPDPAKQNYLLMGSSLVAQLHDALQQTYPDVHFLQATAPSCSVEIHPASARNAGCAALMHYLFTDYLLKNHVDAVLFQVEQSNPTPDSLAQVVRFFRSHNIRVYAIGSQVEYDLPGPALAIASMRRPFSFDLQRHMTNMSDASNQTEREVVEREGGVYISMFHTICPKGSCLLFAGLNIPMETDQAHLSYSGTLLVAKRWHDTDLLRP